MRLSALDPPPRFFCHFSTVGRKKIQIAERKCSFHSFENIYLVFKEIFSSFLSVPRVLYNLCNVPQTKKIWEPLLYMHYHYTSLETLLT